MSDVVLLTLTLKMPLEAAVALASTPVLARDPWLHDGSTPPKEATLDGEPVPLDRAQRLLMALLLDREVLGQLVHLQIADRIMCSVLDMACAAAGAVPPGFEPKVLVAMMRAKALTPVI